MNASVTWRPIFSVGFSAVPGSWYTIDAVAGAEAAQLPVGHPGDVLAGDEDATAGDHARCVGR